MVSEQRLLFGGADAADGGAAVGALALRDGLAVLRGSLDGVLHDHLRLALHAICFDSHGCLTPFCPERQRVEPALRSLESSLRIARLCGCQRDTRAIIIRYYARSAAGVCACVRYSSTIP